jgi:biotin carboxyl carrier protein
MIIYLWYVFKVSLCLIVFYTFYMLALKNTSFFMLNRLYLLLGITASFIIPILKFSIFEGQTVQIITSIIDTRLIEPEYNYFQPKNISNEVNLFNHSMILSVIYFSGVSVLFLKLLFSIVRTIRLKNNSETYRIGKTKIVKIESDVPFSFFNMIFLPKNENNPLIIEHEMTHIRQFHWFDLVLTEIVSLLLWFNPFVVLYKQSLKLQHEYLADSGVTQNTSQIENYLGCMLQQIKVSSSGELSSNFYCKTFKKRIIMITKNKTSVKYFGIYLLVIPLIGLLLFAFTNSRYNRASTSKVEVSESADKFQPSIYPVDSKKITHVAEYGKRTNPITKKNDFHSGIDFAISEGENLIATANGNVIESNYDLKKGNYLLIKHNNTYSTFYSHFKIASVKVGDKIEKGQTIGITGNTGTYSTGPHVHYEVLKNGENVNPKDYMPK